MHYFCSTLLYILRQMQILWLWYGVSLSVCLLRYCGTESEFDVILSVAEVTCPPLPVYNNIGYGRQADCYQHSKPRNCGTSITFSCQKSEILYGKTESYCLESGAWSENIPTCISKEGERKPLFQLPVQILTAKYTIF